MASMRHVWNCRRTQEKRIMYFLCVISVFCVFTVQSTNGDIPPETRKNSRVDDNEVRPKSAVFKLSQQQECSKDVERLCRNSRDNNFAILDCLQSERRPEDVGLSATCDNLLWEYKKNLTHDDRFSDAASRVCSAEAKNSREIQGCSNHHFKKLQKTGESTVESNYSDDQNKIIKYNSDPYDQLKCSYGCDKERLKATLQECQTVSKPGSLLACLMDMKENLTIPQCRQFITKMESIVFSDYRLIHKFVDKCSNDIAHLQCGRLGSSDYKSHSQGQTIECLQQKMPDLGEDCQHEIFRITEIQADDFNLDRPLYFACRDDRERFCSRINAGEGRVYKCLLNHKMDRLMSSECREKLTQRQKLIAQDYKVSKGLAKACRDDIKLYKCRDETSKNRVIRLSQILICLENQLHKDQPVSSDCQQEMMEHRRSVMEDFQISPELVTACHVDIEKHCHEKIEGNGKTIHCLMEHAKPTTRKKQRISEDCLKELEKLLHETDAAEDWRVDPVLKEACQSVVDVACKDIRPGEARVLNCLMEKIGAEIMLDECERSLLQIQYFVVRDFRLDSRLYKACRSNAVSLCEASDNWAESIDKIGSENGALLPCLFRYAYHPNKNLELAPACLQEVRRVMRQRALTVDLHPEIVEPCMEDLGRLCKKTGKHEELLCLQDNLEVLSTVCKEAVGNYTEEEAEHAQLNLALYKACEPLAQKYCEEILKRDIDEGDLMQCLVEHKNDYEAKKHSKCRVAVEHFQMISLKDYRFSFKFKDACKNEVMTHCKNIRSKAEVVQCLSGMVRNDTLLEKPMRVGKECRQQLRLELLQRNEDITLDPILAEACVNDRKQFCKNIQPGEGKVIECLKNNWRYLSSTCHLKIFNREHDEMLDNRVDYTLMTACKRMIKLYCSEVDMTNVLNCLRANRDVNEFDDKCRSVVLRRIAQQNSDYRLNPVLRSACKVDLRRYCSTVLSMEPKDGFPFYEGKVIECLKDKFRGHKLNGDCRKQIAKIIKDSQLDFRQDPILSVVCKDDINKLCQDEDDNGRGRIEECLKIKFEANSITSKDCKMQVAKLVQQTKSDISADPVLYKSCSLDLKHYCYNIPSGDGQQLSCLIEALNSKSLHFHDDCAAKLTARIKMFEHAAQVMPAESMQELYVQVAHSPARNYFIVVTFAVIGMIFFGGLFCGRMTKRVRTDIKNK